MCQYDNHYDARDAVRTHAYKVYRRGITPGVYVSVYQYHVAFLGEMYEAKTVPGDRVIFVERDKLYSGGFHVFLTLGDAQRVADSLAFPGLVEPCVIRVAVDGYIASGVDGKRYRTACYERIIPEEVVA
jgi:hypothetical protein